MYVYVFTALSIENPEDDSPSGSEDSPLQELHVYEDIEDALAYARKYVEENTRDFDQITDNVPLFIGESSRVIHPFCVEARSHFTLLFVDVYREELK